MVASTAFLVALLSASAFAADVYKCPNGAGKIEFQDRPCAGAAGEKIEMAIISLTGPSR